MHTLARQLLDLLLLAIAYAVVGALALQLAIPPGYVAPLFPPAGIALAAVLMWGPRMLPGVWLGSALIQIMASWNSGQFEINWISTLALPCGAALQAWLGAVLAHRYVGVPGTLDTPAHILKFLFIIAPASCLVSASVAIPILAWTGMLPPPELSFSWLNWWVGDAIGVLIVTPLMFVFFAQPAQAWRSRRLTVALPLALALALLGAAYLQLKHWEETRIQTRFNIDAGNLSSLIRGRFNDHLDALQAVERLMATSESVDRQTFRDFTDPWFSRFPGIQVLGWAPRVTAAQRADFEARVSKSDRPGFRIINRDNAGQAFPAPADEEYLPILFIEPEATNRAALGLNPWAFEPAREPLESTRKSGQPKATEPIRLIQEVGSQRGIVVYQGVFSPSLDFIGMVYAALRMDDAVHAAFEHHRLRDIELCLADIMATVGNSRLAGKDGCKEPSWNASRVAWSEDFDFAGRTWRIAFRATPEYLQAQRNWATWTMLAVALLSVGFLGAFLLIITGRSRTIEELVARRTQELRDATDETEIQRASLAQAQRLARLGSWETLLPHGTTTWSDEMYRILGRQPGEAVDEATLIGHLHPDDQDALRKALDNARAGRLTPTLDCRIVVANRPGEEIFTRLSIAPAHAKQKPPRIRGAIQDITESKRNEARIQRLAHHDTLTGLPNRAHLMNRAMQVLAQARRHGHSAALLFLDLDRFKTVNDSLGHPVGDRFLMAAAARLRNCLREEDVIGRIGGDEFVIVLPQLDLPDDAANVAQKIIETLSRPFQIDRHEVIVTVSIGIAAFPRDGNDVEALLRNADTAMYSAKDAGRNTFQFYASDMNDRALERLVLESNLRRAIERGELCLHYQPQIRLPGGEIASVEALVRWNHPELGLIAPARFIPIAEESSLIVPLGEWVLREACRQQLAWRADGLRAVPVAINISALQFRRPDFVETVERIITEMGADPAMLELEVTETALMQPTETIFLQLEALRRMGFGLALDDFGTGYSSLAYLKKLPINRLKLDRSFVQDLPGDPEDVAVASATLSMARDLGLEVVAEGVETAEQRDFLYARGCALMQGFLYARPMPADEMTERLRG